MAVYREGVVLATTLTMSAGFIASGWDEQRDEVCVNPTEPCRLNYIPVYPVVPDQPHTETGENLPLIPTTLNILSASGGAMSNVHAPSITFISAPIWSLDSPSSSFDDDQLMAAQFRNAGLNVTVRLSKSQNSEIISP